MRIVLVSGHGRGWDSGASLIYLHLDENLRRLGYDDVLFTMEDYLSSRVPRRLYRFFGAPLVRRRILREVATADVVEVAGGLGWYLFAALRSGSQRENRRLLVTRLHGLEFLDEQARFIEEIAGSIRLPLKYKLLTCRWINWQEFRSIALSDLVLCYTSRDVDGAVLRGLKPEADVATTVWGVDPRYFRSGTITAGDERADAQARRGRIPA